MKHPLHSLPIEVRKPIFISFLIFTLLILVIFQFLNRPLITEEAPLGIISLQLAWTQEKAASIISSWNMAAVFFGAFGLGFDYLFMTSYAIALALGSLLVQKRHPGWYGGMGAWIGYAAFFAATLDAVENFGQAVQLLLNKLDMVPFVSTIALVKFSLIILTMLYGIFGWLWPKR